MNIALDWYRTFQAVANCGSITEAARLLALSQPAVSQTIRQLETQLGAPLFTRHTKGVSLTREGVLLLGHINEALTLIDAGEKHFDALRGLSEGQLRIGASDSLCKHWLLPRLARFHHAHPGIGIRVTNRTSSETMILLARGEADIGLVNLPLDIPGTYEVQEIVRVQDCFVYNPHFFSHMPTTVSWAQLAHMPLILLENASATRRSLDALAKAQGAEWTPEIELGSLDLLVEFALSGFGIAAAVAEFVAPLLTEKRLRQVNLTPSIPSRAIGMVYRRHVPLPHCAQKFLEEISAYASKPL